MTTTSIAAGFDGWCLKCGPGTDDDLRPVPDMLRFVGKRDGSRLCDAAIIVRDELRRIVGLDLELFMLQPGQRFAEKITMDFPARKAIPGRLAGMVPDLKRRGFAAVPSFDADGSGFAAVWPGVSMRTVPLKHQTAQDAVEGLYGPQGAVQVAFETWCNEAARPDIATDPARWMWARLAIRASVAERLFADVDLGPPLPAAVPSHDCKRWGHNITCEARPVALCRVSDAITGACVPGSVLPQGMALRDAARWVVEGLAAAPGVRWFMLDRATRPEAITDRKVWREALPSGVDLLHADHLVLEAGKWVADSSRSIRSFADFPRSGVHKFTRAELAARGALHLADDGAMDVLVFDAEWTARIPGVPAVVGVPGLVELLRELVQRLDGPEALDAGELAAVAVPAAALAALPWMTSRADIGGSVAGVCEAAAVQPIGGAWPHAKGAPWSDAERDALFEMRHRCGMTDKEIAAAIELDSAQRISQVIGTKDAHRIKDGSAYPEGLRWRPSRDLLARCGIEAGAKLVRVSKTG